MTWYITDRDAYVAALPEIGALYRELMGRNYPTMAVVQVAALVEPAARIEIETTAVVPEGRSEEHTSELQSLMRISYAVFCLKKKKQNTNIYEHIKSTCNRIKTNTHTR